jgi:hypothetical protein
MHRLWLRPLPSAILGGCLVAVVSASCTVGDAICTDKTVDEDRNDDCPYGPPGGPQRDQADTCQVTIDKENCTKTFRDDVYPILMRGIDKDNSGGGCTVPGCHGPTAKGGIEAIVLPEGATADELYNLLAGYENEAGQKYWALDDSDTFALCNLKATIGGGAAMPPSAGLTNASTTAVDDNDISVVEEWIRCGMELNGAGTGGGGTGGEGTGGEGVGGAGGGI